MTNAIELHRNYICSVFFLLNNQVAGASCPLCRAGVTQDQLVEPPPDQTVEDQGFQTADLGPWQSSAKIDALMTALVQQRQEDKSVKSLVISQFTAFLTILETPLR